MAYSLGEAAKAVRLSKATLSRAIKTGKLSAEKQLNGSFKIEVSELHRVYPPISATVSDDVMQQHKTSNVTVGNQKKQIENELLKIEIQAEKSRNSDLEKRITSLERDKEILHRDKEHLQKLTLSSPDQKKQSSQQSNPSIWSKIFGLIDLRK